MHIDAKIYAKDFFLSQTVVFERVASPPKPRLSSLSKSNCKTSMKSNTFLKEIYLLSRVVFGHLVRPRHICLIEKRLPLSVYLRTNVHGTLCATYFYFYKYIFLSLHIYKVLQIYIFIFLSLHKYINHCLCNG